MENMIIRGRGGSQIIKRSVRLSRWSEGRLVGTVDRLAGTTILFPLAWIIAHLFASALSPNALE